MPAGGTVPLGRLRGESGVGWRLGCVFPVVGRVALPSLRTLLFVCLRGDVRAAHGRGTIPRVLPG